MQRFGITVSLILFLLFAFTLSVMAQSGNTGTVLTGANLRAGPGTTYAIVGQAQTGQTITIAAENPAGDWYQLATGQWIAAFLVEVAPTTAITTAVTSTVTTTVPTSATGAFVTQVANLRAGPSTTTAIAGQVAKDQAVSIIGRNAAGDWYKLLEGQWIAAFLVANAPTTLPIVATTAAATATPNAAPIAATTPEQAPPTATPAQPTVAPTPIPPIATAVPANNCHPSYPDVCIPPAPPDLNCDDVPYGRFRVVGADPHGFDRDNDGIGCESN